MAESEVARHEMKKCPYCGEEILSVARKCRYCDSMLDGMGQIATYGY